MEQQINDSQVSQKALDEMVNTAILELTITGFEATDSDSGLALKEGALAKHGADADMLHTAPQEEAKEEGEAREEQERRVTDTTVTTEDGKRRLTVDETKQMLSEATTNVQQLQKTDFWQMASKLLGIKQEKNSSTETHWVSSPAFDLFTAFMIVLNSILMGIEVEVLSQGYHSELAIDALGLGFSLFFLGELILRLVVFRRSFFTNEDKQWNMFDLLLVLGSLFDSALLFVGGDGQVDLGGLKTLKMLRIARLFRVFRFFRQLSSLALMVIDSMASLFWALLMFSLIVYVFAITISSLTIDWLKQQSPESGPGWKQALVSQNRNDFDSVIQYYGSLSKTIYSLFQATLNGEDWGNLCSPLWDVDRLAAWLMIGYVLFTMIAMMNIFTGVFVDNALQNARKQREVQLEEQLEMQKIWLDQVREFFSAADTDGDGSITVNEIETLINDPIMTAYLQLIGFQFDDATKVFRLFDKDRSGEIGFDEFIHGCETLKGPARKVDVHLLMSEVNDLARMLSDRQ